MRGVNLYCHAFLLRENYERSINLINNTKKRKDSVHMAKKPNLKNLESLFKTNDEFSLTDAQYEKKMGATLPKNTSY